MANDPVIEKRNEISYVGIRTTVPHSEIASKLPPLIQSVFTYLSVKQVAPAGGPFFRYRRMEGNEFHVDVGVPVKDEIAAEEGFIADRFPEGNYAVITYTGNYMNLGRIHMQLEDWMKKNGYQTGADRLGSSSAEGYRAEFYLNDPRSEPNPEKWVTEVVDLLIKK